MSTLFNAIVQMALPSTHPTLAAIVNDEAALPYHPCKWFKEWAEAKPEAIWYTYWIGGCLIGFVFESEADYTTLSEFVQRYEEGFDQFWSLLQGEMDDWVWDQQVARVAAAAYKAKA